MEFANHGKLLEVLRDLRPTRNYYNDPVSPLPMQKLLKYLYQVSAGMEFVANQAIVHRDLAARNVLVTSDWTCKVADFGLARCVSDSGLDAAYEQKSRGALPIRWMAPESLTMARFSTKSDVWSLGILAWELVTLGSTPYPGMSAGEVLSAVKLGYHMERPSHCPPSIFELMKSTWRENPRERPTFSDLKNTISDHLKKSNDDYIDLTLFVENAYYNVMTQSPGEKV